jgi:hypothetical protein
VGQGGMLICLFEGCAEREEKDYRPTVGCIGVQYVIIRWSRSLGAIWLRTRYGVWTALGGFLLHTQEYETNTTQPNKVP